MVEVAGVQVVELGLGDLLDLLGGDAPDLGLVRRRRARRDPRGLLQEDGGGGALGDELKSPVGVEIVISTGIVVPFMSLVRSLNCITN